MKVQIKEQINSGINKIKALKKAFKTMSLVKALTFMFVGVLIILLGILLSSNIIYVIGAIFFIIGAVFLLLDLL